MKHKIQSIGSEGEPICKIPRSDEINIFEKSLSDSILTKSKQNHVLKSTTSKRKIDTKMMVDDDLACVMVAKRRKGFIKEENGSGCIPFKLDGDVSEIEMDSSNEHLGECKTEKCDFTCYTFWRLPLPDIDLCEIG